MIITCEECSTRFVLDDGLIKPDGSKVRCSKCLHVFTAFPAASGDETPGASAQPPFFDEPEFQDNPDFDISQDNDLTGPETENSDLENSDIDFSEIEFDEPQFEPDPPDYKIDADDSDSLEQDIEIQDSAQDFDEDGLDFETPDFEPDKAEPDGPDFEFGEAAGSTPDFDTGTADIEISFDREQDEETGVELESLPDDGEDYSTKMLSPQEFEPDEPGLEPDTKEDEEEIYGQPDEHQPDEHQPDEHQTDEQIEPSVLDQDKFAEYDKVLEQETEPEETTDTAVPDSDEQGSPSLPETPMPGAGEEIEATAETLTDQKPLITPSSAQSVRQKRGAKKRSGISLPVKILLVLFLLILAAYVAIIRLGLTVPMVSDIQIPYVSEWLQPKHPPKPKLNPVPEESSINGRFVSNKSAGDLFIVTGRVINPCETAVSYIQVKGTLVKKDDSKAGELTAYCGNVIPEETLESGNISDITKQMDVKQGNQDTNVNIKPGDSVMFMLVFANLPEDLGNFTVAVNGYEPAKE